MSAERISIVIRALNEEKWLGEALTACRKQQLGERDLEIILVDSGSTDRTMEIAEQNGCRVVHIKKADFTFGRSLNTGCAAASGDFLVFISAHCIPAHENWLANLLEPLADGRVDYVYGRQIGHDVTRFSERQIFAQYFPDHDRIPQAELFLNNANAAIRKSVWEQRQFDETVTGLEDMVLARTIMAHGGHIGYVADAPVFHIHEESLQQTRNRYYREALTMREIMPHVHFHIGDFLRYVTAAILHDFSEALRERVFFANAGDIIAFRTMQFWGNYRGHNEHRILSRAEKERYYYPRPGKAAKYSASDAQKDDCRGAASETILKDAQ